MFLLWDQKTPFKAMNGKKPKIRTHSNSEPSTVLIKMLTYKMRTSSAEKKFRLHRKVYFATSYYRKTYPKGAKNQKVTEIRRSQKLISYKERNVQQNLIDIRTMRLEQDADLKSVTNLIEIIIYNVIP